ncbi:MAG: hypothetical protein SGPRY_006159 [Prymnesium sp.]
MPSLLRPLLLSAALSALWLPPLCSGLRVSLSFETSRRIAALQDFASVGGQVVTDLSISLKSCITNTTETEAMCTWDGANQLFMILLSSQQLENLTRSISRNELSDTFECEQPSMARTAISLLRWQEAKERTSDGYRAYLPDGGDAVASAQVGVTQPRYDVTKPRDLRFRIEYRLPVLEDLYTLVLVNCDDLHLSVEGESTFHGSDGEKLSLSQVDLILARVIISAITFVAAIALAALCLYRRAVTVPLQWILVFAFLARTCRQLLLMGPMIAAAQDEVLPRSLSAPVDVVDTWEDPVRLFVKRAPLPCQPVLMSTFLAEVASLCSSFAFLSTLFALAAGRHFTNPVLTTREQEILVGAMSLYFFFGMLQSACINEISCGVSVLSFQVGRCPCFGPHKLLTWLPRQVLRILIIFVIFLLINASVDRLRHEHGYQWDHLFPELLRLTSLLAVRRRIILVYLVLPILFMFLEVQVLDWRAIWFKRIWRECLELYFMLAVTWRIVPSSMTCALPHQTL